MKKFQGDTGVSETMPTLHRDTRKHPYGNPKWKNFRMSLGFDGMNDNQKERYIEDRDAIAEWNNRPISELTEEEQTKMHELESAKRMHIETLKEILPEGMKIEDWINNLRLREQDDYKRVYNDILNNTYEKPKKQDGDEIATRQDSLDTYNKSEAHLQRYLDDGYTITGNEPLRKTRTEYDWTDKELPDLPDEVWAELKDLWSTFFVKLINPKKGAAYTNERDSLLENYNNRARAIQEQYGLEDPPKFAAVRQKEPDTWDGDKRIFGEEKIIDYTPTPAGTRGAKKTFDIGSRHAPFGHRSVQDIDEYRYLQGDMQNNVVNPNMPLGYYDRRIEPVNRISLEKMVPDATGAMVPDYVDLNSYNSLDEELGLPVDPNQMFKPSFVLPVPDSAREKLLVNPFIEPLEPLGIPEINLERPDGLMESNISLPKPGRKPVLIYKRNHKMRTGQEPDHYVYYDSKGNPKVRPVEPEELEYYKKENRIRNPQRITASFKDGGDLPKAQFGRGIAKLLPKVTKAAPRSFDNLNSLYRVVDVPFGSSSDEIAKAAIYGTTIPSMPTIGRRTGYSDIQGNTPFDVLNTTNSQNWIAGEGLGDRNSLINLYGGNNPYVVKMSRENPFADSETLTSINNRTDILKNFSWPYTGNVGKWNPTTGQYDLPLDLGEGVFTTVGKNADELAKIRPGSIVNPNYLSRGDNNITTIFGPKGMQVRQPQEILSAKDYLKRMTDDPNFTYKEGGNLPKAQLGQGLKQLIKSSSIGKGLKNAPLTVPLSYNTPLAANIINYTDPLTANGFGNINQEALPNWDAAVSDYNFSEQADNFKLDIPLTRVLDSKGISIRDGKLFSKTGDHYYAPDFTSSRNTTHWSYGHVGDPGHGEWSKKSTAIISDFKTLKGSGHAMDLNPTDTYFYSKDDFKIPDNSLILTRDKSLYDKIRLQTDLVNVKWVDPTQVNDKQFKELVDSYSTNGPEKYNYQEDLFNDYLQSNWKKGIDVAQYKPASYLDKNRRDNFGGGQSKMHSLDPLSYIESIQTKDYRKNHGLYGEIETWEDSADFGKGIGTLDAMLKWPKPMQVLEMEKLLRLYKHKPEALRVQTELANLNGFETYKEFKASVSKAEMDNFKRYGGEQLPKAQFGKGFKKFQQKIRDNRVANTPVRDATSEEVLEMLSSFGPDSPMLQGEYDPREKEIVMYKDDLDTLKHEQVHASQYGPLQRMWYKMNDNGNDPAYKGARIQNKPMRKAYKQLTKGKNQVQDLLLPDNERTFNAAGQYVLNTGEEFEAVLNTGINAAKSQGVNFNSSFDDVYSQLLNIKNPTNNMRGLTKFMSNKFTDAQKDIIFKAIQDEMPLAVPLPVMNSKS